MKFPVRAAIDALKPFSRFFVERPRFAAVLAVTLALAGAISLLTLPVAQYPEITPPRIVVSCSYPGANAREVMATVAGPMEEELNGVEGMLFMSSGCDNSGSYSVGVTFEVGTDRDAAQMKVQNRVQQALSRLPVEVKNTGLRVRCASEDQLGFICIRSPGGRMSRMEISDYIHQTVQPALLRVPGVGDVTVRGPVAAIRVWLDVKRLAACGLSPGDVAAAIRSQNMQASIGHVGASPSQNAQTRSFTLVSRGRLRTPEEFGDIVVRTGEQGGLVRLRDVARTEVSQRQFMYDGSFDGMPAVSIDVNQLPGANAVRTVEGVRRTLDELARRFPADLEWSMPYDVTQYVRSCIREIAATLLVTFCLVGFVCWAFLRDWRSTLVPLATIPVSVMATFAVMAALGYSLNMLTLFGLVLAIGTVVDDSIVVVERVRHLMSTEGLNPKEATIRAMHDVTGAVVATTLVLLGIFVPVGFIGGIAGQIYRQFSVTLATAVVFSTFNALTLSPALCAVLMRPPAKGGRGAPALFDAALDRVRCGYLRAAVSLARRPLVVALLLLASVCCTASMLKSMPKSFIPDEDQGVVKCDCNLPEGTTLPATMAACNAAAADIKAIPGVKSVLTVAGNSFVGGTGENQSMMVVSLDDWERRRAPGLDHLSLRDKIASVVAERPDAVMRAFVPAAVPGISTVGGITVGVQSRGDLDAVRLDRELREIVRKLRESPLIADAVCGYNAGTPHVRLTVDRVKCELLKVPLSEVYATLQSDLGSLYVNDVNLGTQVNRVTIQADWSGRASPADVLDLRVRSSSGAMVPIGSLATVEAEPGPRTIYRYNQYVFAGINVMLAPGVATGAGMDEVERILDAELPPDYGYDWTNMSFHEKRNKGMIVPILALAVLFGYLFLVAQYESWIVPVPVMASVFAATCGALLGLKLAGLSFSVYAQLGLVLLVGLASKSAILIVEFAKTARERGESAVEAAATGASERFRAVIMTALTFMLGMLPMVFATGAGAVSRRAIGVAAFSGMAASTFVGIVLVPGLYVLFCRKSCVKPDTKPQMRRCGG